MEPNADERTRYERARKRLQKKREFATHVIAYLAVNTLLIILWATADDRGSFWPIFPLIGWGIGLFFHGWGIYRPEPSEAEIRKEMERMG